MEVPFVANPPWVSPGAKIVLGKDRLPVLLHHRLRLRTGVMALLPVQEEVVPGWDLLRGV